jgi:hypothetical protein
VLFGYLGSIHEVAAHAVLPAVARISFKSG